MINLTNEQLLQKWKPLLECEDLPVITDVNRRNSIAVVLENTEQSLKEASGWSPVSLTEAVPVNVTGQVQNYDPILISLVRRAMPNLIAYDICGVQPMTGPTGLIFAMRSNYDNSTVNPIAETFYNEVNTAYSGTGTHTGTTPTPTATGVGVPTANMETNTAFN